MRVNRVVLGRSFVLVSGVLAALAVLPGCSSSSSDGGTGGGASATLNPPANIDVKSCASITGDFVTIAQTCEACCTTAGFTESTSFDDKCVCGKETAMDTSCLAKDEASCPTCCTAAGFSGYGFFGDSGSSTCTCSGKFDDKVCLPAAAKGDEACQVCCLNNGYLGDAYSNFGTPDCSCN